MVKTMDKSEVLDILEARGTKFVTVVFLKKDGTVRKVNGHLKSTSNMVWSERGQAQAAAMKSRGQVPIYAPHEEARDGTKGCFKSFYADRVLEIH